jgi:hypothetical protein
MCIRTSSPSKNEDDLKGRVLGHMRMLQKKPERVPSYFKYPSTRYAA